MQIRDILREKGTQVVTIGLRQAIHDVIDKLNEHSIGALVVMDDNEEVAGIITERDILHICGNLIPRAQDAGAGQQAESSLVVEDAMTRDLIIGVPDDNLNYVMGIMSKNHIRHLPILDNGKLEGIVSIGDLVSARLEQQVFENRNLRDYIQGAM